MLDVQSRRYGDSFDFTGLETNNGSDSSGVLLQEFTYHPLEERVLVKKTYNSTGAVAETVIYVSDTFVKVINSSGTFDYHYVWHEGQLVAQVNPDGSKYFILGDRLGSTSVITNGSGTVIENTSYSPYGEIISGGQKTRYSYTGQEYDSVLGDYDYKARRYEASLARFLQPDVLLSNVYNPQSLNRYSYALNNPYKYYDKSGFTPQTPENWLQFGVGLMDLVQGVVITVAGIGYVAGTGGIGAIAGGAVAVAYGSVRGASGIEAAKSAWNNEEEPTPLTQTIAADIACKVGVDPEQAKNTMRVIDTLVDLDMLLKGYAEDLFNPKLKKSQVALQVAQTTGETVATSVSAGSNMKDVYNSQQNYQSKESYSATSVGWRSSGQENIFGEGRVFGQCSVGPFTQIDYAHVWDR